MTLSEIIERHRAMPARGGSADIEALLSFLRETRDALTGLLEDTQHSEHDCGDADCPVLTAELAISRLAAFDTEAPT